MPCSGFRFRFIFKIKFCRLNWFARAGCRVLVGARRVPSLSVFRRHEGALDGAAGG